MAKVENINAQTQNPCSVFGSISKGVAGGALAGYAAKYMLPLVGDEIDDEYKTIVNEIRLQSNRTKGLPIEAIRNLENRTPAQDVFLKMIDSEAKEEKSAGFIGDIVNRVTKQNKAEASKLDKAFQMRNIIKGANLGADDMKELRNIIAQVNDKARSSCKRYIAAYNSTVKSMKRPTIAFVTMGAVAGFFVGLIHKVITGQMDNI